MGRQFKGAAFLGEIVPVTVANPAPAAEWTYTLPDGFEYLLTMMYCELLTSAVVANRGFGLVYRDAGAIPLAHVRHANNMTAGALWRITFSLGLVSGAALVQFFTYPLPKGPIPGGYSIGTSSNLLSAGDQFQNIRLLFSRSVA
jgi:hypothetical protein